MNLPKSNPPISMLTISVGFSVLFLVWDQQWALIAGVAIGLIGVFSTYLSVKIEWVWLRISGILGLVVPKILLTSVFFLILLPVSLISKLFRKEDQLNIENKKQSLLINRNMAFKPEDFKDPW